jgi:putative peptidoglycan lipid II flippase
VPPRARSPLASHPVTKPSGPAHSAARSARWVAAGILLSRLAGLVRERLLARFFGTSLEADAFRAALRMPNVLQNLLGEGTLSASFIPVYAELLEQGREEEAGRVAGATFALLLALAGGLSLLGAVFAPAFVTVTLPGFSGLRRELTIQAVRIMFPMTGIMVLSAWALGILNSHRRFFISYVAPVAWNAAMIAALLLLGGRLGRASLVIALAWAALIGGGLQFAVQLPFLLRLERRLQVRWAPQLPGVRTAIRNAGPAILGRGVVQLSGYVDVLLASLLTAGAVASLGYAMTLYLLPISLFGMSVAAAELPELSRKRQEATAVLRERVNLALRQIAVFVVPSFIGYLILGDVVVATLYQTGDFTRADTLVVHATLAALSLGLIASTGTRLYSSAFFALQDTRTPAIFAGVRVVLSSGAGAALMFPFDRLQVAPGHTLGPVGLGIGAGVAAWLEWWLDRRSLSRRIGPIGAGGSALARMVVAALIAALAARALLLVLPARHPAATGVVVIGAYAVLYFAGAHVLGLRDTLAPLLRALRPTRSGVRNGGPERGSTPGT